MQEVASTCATPTGIVALVTRHVQSKSVASMDNVSVLLGCSFVREHVFSLLTTPTIVEHAIAPVAKDNLAPLEDASPHVQAILLPFASEAASIPKQTLFTVELAAKPVHKTNDASMEDASVRQANTIVLVNVWIFVPIPVTAEVVAEPVPKDISVQRDDANSNAPYPLPQFALGAV